MVEMSSLRPALRRPRDGRARSRPRTAPGTLARDLERRRLQHRAGRIEQVLLAMRALAGSHGDAVPAPLGTGIDDFSRELSQVRRRLRQLDDDGDRGGEFEGARR